MKTCIMNTLIVIESLTIVNLLNKVQFPFVKVFPPQMLSSSSEGAIVQAVPIAFAPVNMMEDGSINFGSKTCLILYEIISAVIQCPSAS